MAVIPYLQRTSPLVDGIKMPTDDTLRTLNALIKATNDNSSTSGDISALSARVDTVETDLATLNQEFALQGSYPESFVAPLIQADNTGAVSIVGHTRFYADGTSVTVDPDTILSGQAATKVLRFYYDDPTMAGGAVTYLFTVDPAAAPIQMTGRHVVGKVTIPAGGPNNGTYLFPPGHLP